MESPEFASPIDARVFPSLTEAVNAIGVTPATLVIAARVRLIADTVVPATLSIRVESPGLIEHGAFALTILGSLEAGRFQVFAGDGRVLLGPASVLAVYAEWFGARGDGSTDDTRACQKALAATSAGLVLQLLNRSYAVSSLALGPGMGGICGPGILKQNGIKSDAVVRIQGGGQPGNVVARAVLEGITVEANAAMVAILLSDAVDCRIEHCRVAGLRDGHEGIHIHYGCVNTLVRNNRIEADATQGSLVCIAIASPMAEGIAGFFLGNGGQVTYLPETTYGNVMEGNYITGGTHGIAICGSSRNRIVNNTIADNSHRNINICPASRQNIITHNTLLNAGSSAVAMAYGSSLNLVAHNVIQSCVTGVGYDRDAIHAYVGSCGNTIADNQITGDFRYGVYLAASARHNMVQNNAITLTAKRDLDDDFTVGVALENDWPERPLPDGAIYSRQNFGSAAVQAEVYKPLKGDANDARRGVGSTTPYTWASENSAFNVIQGNAISGCTCGIYLSQIGEKFSVADNRILNNSLSAIGKHPIYIHGDIGKHQVVS